MIAQIFIGLVALIHLYILVLEMFLWETPFGRKTFGMSREKAADTAILAKNQGLYNGVLAAGLLWTFFLSDPACQFSAQLFFLSSIAVVGIYGAFTAKFSIFFVQALPALIALALRIFFTDH